MRDFYRCNRSHNRALKKVHEDKELLAAGAVGEAGDVVEVGVGTGSGIESGETGSMWASAEMLGSAAGVEGETAIGIEESKEAGATTDGADKGTVETTVDATGRTNTGAGSNC